MPSRRNPFSLLGGDELPEDRSWFDTRQVCLNGHEITSMAVSHPEYRKKRCPSCGAATIMECPKCGVAIQGYHHIPGFAYVDDSRPQACCHECGEPYPWAAKKAQDAEKPTTVVLPIPVSGEAKQDPSKGSEMTDTANKVFIVHGHDEAMKQEVARVISILGLEPIILHEQSNQGRTIIEKFEKNAAAVGFAVVLLSGDDMAYPSGTEHKKAKPRPRARQNVVMELGFFLASLGRDRVFPLYKEVPNFDLPSDYQGVVYVPYDAAGGWRGKLVQELQAAKYDVDANKLFKK